MSEQSKDRLEEFFNKAAQNYQFEYEEKDWEKLEKKLDTVEGKGATPYWKSNGKKLMLSAIILITSLIALFYVLETDPALMENSSDELTIKYPDNSSSDLRFSQEDKNSSKELVSRKPVQSSIIPNQENNELTETSGKRTSSYDARNDDLNSEGTQSAKQKLIVRKGKSNDNASSKKENSASESRNTGDGASLREDVSIPYVNSIPLNQVVTTFSLTPPAWSDVHNTESDPEEIIKEDAFTPNVSLAFTVAPDLSTVGLGDFTKPGTRLGGFISYNFHNRWSARVGAILTRNIYTAKGEQYNSYNNWGGNASPIKADGSCAILDIPISLRYNYLVKDKNVFFITTGLNSYVMLKEKYDFEYEYPQSYYMDHWESEKVSQHVFGLVNLSTGWERQLSDRWSFELEPFINIPITGIGSGEVDLFTFGSYLSLKYKLRRSNGR